LDPDTINSDPIPAPGFLVNLDPEPGFDDQGKNSKFLVKNAIIYS
jgi:hypothetical protein